AAVYFGPLIVTLAALLAGPAVGALVDHYGPRRVILLSFVCEALIVASFYFHGPSLVGFFLRYALLGTLALGTTHIAFARLVALWFDRRRGLALGVALTGVGFGGAILAPLSQSLINTYGWRSAYLWLALGIGALIVPLLAVVVRDTPQSRGWAPDGERLAPTNGLPMKSRGLSAMAAAQIQSLLFAGLVCGRLVTGWLMDRYFAPRVALGFLAAPIVGIAVFTGSADSSVGAVAALLLGLAAGAEVAGGYDPALWFNLALLLAATVLLARFPPFPSWQSNARTDRPLAAH
ncbi:MAG: MFS transporter, partial [Steroidobacteraceae bacterium]|nr:MFS transporter [Steroidobacteraceae bacterium]